MSTITWVAHVDGIEAARRVNLTGLDLDDADTIGDLSLSSMGGPVGGLVGRC